MERRKRSKQGSRDSEDSNDDEKVNWAKEYLKYQKRKDEELRELNEKFRDEAVRNKELEKDLEIANTELLKVKEKLSARGAIELLESQKFSSAPPNCTTRQQKYEWLYNNNRTFEKNVRKCVTEHLSSAAVGRLANDLYASASYDIHTCFNYGSEVIVNKDNYQSSQLNLLEAICLTLNVRIRKL